jgi:hypothetical protein
MQTPYSIIAADKLVHGHPDLRESPQGLYSWSLRINHRNFVRFREAAITRSRTGNTREVWCRIDDDKLHKTSKPSPLVFEAVLRKALGQRKMSRNLVTVFTA